MDRIVLTKAQRRLLQIALRSPTGNPWMLIGMSARGGGATRRMFEGMIERGLFDGMNRITDLGRSALASQEKGRG